MHDTCQIRWFASSTEFSANVVSIVPAIAAASNSFLDAEADVVVQSVPTSGFLASCPAIPVPTWNLSIDGHWDVVPIPACVVAQSGIGSWKMEMMIGASLDEFLVDPLEAERVLGALNDILDTTTDDSLRDILDEACAEIAAMLDPSAELEVDDE